ncbi:MAG: hypothetical protein ABI460_12575 [Caldimonas sp.]
MRQLGLLNALHLTPTDEMQREGRGGGNDAGGAQGRLEAHAAHARLLERVAEVEKLVRAAHDLLPVVVITRLTLPRELQALDKEVKAAQGLALGERVDLARRLDELAVHAKTVAAMVRGDLDLLNWADKQAATSKATKLVDAIATIGDAIEECDTGIYGPGLQALLDLRAEWEYAIEDWARMQGRLQAIGAASGAIEKCAPRLPPCKELKTLLDTVKDLEPLGGPMPPRLLESGDWVALRKPLEGLELACAAFVASPTLPTMLDDLVAVPISGAWKERDATLLAVALAIGKGDKAGLPIAVGTLDGLVRAAREAFDEIKRWLNELDALTGPAAAILKQIGDAAEGSMELRALDLLARCRERIAAPLVVARIAPDARIATGEEVGGYKTWAAEIATALSSNAELVKHLGEAYKSKGNAISKDTLKCRLTLVGAFDKGRDMTTGFGTGIAAAYAGLLNTKGPWRERMKKDVAAQEISAWLKLRWLLPDDDTTETLASLITGADKKAHELFQGLGITLALFNALRVHYPGMATLIRTINDYPNADRLGHLVNSYLPNKVVSGASFEALVAAGQVSLSGGGYRNPFRYYCASCGMAEAEAKLDVMWLHATGGPEIVWGTVHVHYHGRTITTPNAGTYYHVKVSDHAPSLQAAGRVTAGGARNLVNGAIPAGQTWA